MFFRRKPQNRRVGREYVLDVKLRSSQVSKARKRLAFVSVSIVFAAVFGVFLLWRLGGWALDRLVYENPTFAIQEIDLQTDGVIASEQLRLWAGVKGGENLLALDLTRLKRNLEIIPFIQTVSVERIMPHRLRVGGSEREPIAQISVARQHLTGGSDQV